VVCVAADAGGYRFDRGFDPESKAGVPVLTAVPRESQDAADDLEDTEQLSAAAYKTIATHNTEVGELAQQISKDLVPARTAELLNLAGRWHDLGKAHPAFQAIIEVRGEYEHRLDLAKAPENAWQKPCVYRSKSGEIRRGFRHELASCLGLFAVLQTYDPAHAALLGPWAQALALLGPPPLVAPTRERDMASPLEQEVLRCTAQEFDLLAYLVVSHHGKVRVALHAGPKDQDYLVRDDRGFPIRGVREGDALPQISLDGATQLPMLTLTLGPASLGLSARTGRSWRDRTAGLLEQYGPATLAYFEALLIAADRRASKLTTSDPLLSLAVIEGKP
jgi:CRISPR-associated endonuclease/helicase Cas3